MRCIDDQIEKIIEEIVAIAEYSREFPICLWICGDIDVQNLFLKSGLSNCLPIRRLKS